MNDFIFKLYDEKLPVKPFIAAVLFAVALVAILYGGSFVLP